MTINREQQIIEKILKEIFVRDSYVLQSYDGSEFNSKSIYYSDIEDIRIIFSVYSSKDNIVFIKNDVIKTKLPVPQKPAWFVNKISLADYKLEKGKYKLTILATDLSSFNTAEKTAEFKIN